MAHCFVRFSLIALNGMDREAWTTEEEGQCSIYNKLIIRLITCQVLTMCAYPLDTTPVHIR